MRLFAAGLLAVVTGCVHPSVSGARADCPEVPPPHQAPAQQQPPPAQHQPPPRQPAVSAPSGATLDLEPVTSQVFVDRRRGLVYALEPGLVALDLESGAVRWRVAGAPGGQLFSVGALLAMGGPTGLTFVDPNDPGAARTCALKFPAPPQGTDVHVHAFARGDQPFVYWSSSSAPPPRGGPPTDLEGQRRAGSACGIVKLNPADCTTTPESLEDWLPERPSGRLRWPPEPLGCENVSPLDDIPAALASAPKPSLIDTLFGGGAPKMQVRVNWVESTPAPCKHRVTFTLSALANTGAERWHRALPKQESDLCGPP
jgi:hypothetical protein